MRNKSKDLLTTPAILEDWLTANKARYLNESKAPDGVLVWYWIGMRLLIVHLRTKGGWDVYAPLDETNDVNNTMKTLTNHFKKPG